MRALRVLAAVVLAAAAVTASATRAQPAFTYDPTLVTLARETLLRSMPATLRPVRREWRRIAVRCYLSRTSFERSFERRFGVSARKVIAYYAGGDELHLRSLTCENVRFFMAGRHTLFTSAAFAILVHEALHRQGLRNERLTTCFANEAVRWGTEWLGYTREDALRARNLAFEYTRRYSPPAYFMGRPTCLALARRTTWREYVVRR